MQINPSEIDSVEEAGILDGSPVKLVKLKGGFWIGIGRPKGKMREEALSAGSHPAIVKYNIEKQHPNFQPSMMKSEFFADNTIVDRHSHFLSDDLRKSGHEIYSVQAGPKIDFHITKYGQNVATIESKINDKTLEIKQSVYPKEFVRAISGATIEKSASCGASKIRLEK